MKTAKPSVLSCCSTLMRYFIRARDGALLVELALVTPFIILLFIAIAQFGFALYVQATLQTAVRSAIRDASIADASMGPASGTCNTGSVPADSVGEVVCTYLSNTKLFASNTDFTVMASQGTYDNETSATEDDLDNMLSVTVQVPLNKVIFIDFNGLLTGTRTLQAYATMQLEP